MAARVACRLSSNEMFVAAPLAITRWVRCLLVAGPAHLALSALAIPSLQQLLGRMLPMTFEHYNCFNDRALVEIC